MIFDTYKWVLHNPNHTDSEIEAAVPGSTAVLTDRTAFAYDLITNTYTAVPTWATTTLDLSGLAALFVATPVGSAVTLPTFLTANGMADSVLVDMEYTTRQVATSLGVMATNFAVSSPLVTTAQTELNAVATLLHALRFA